MNKIPMPSVMSPQQRFALVPSVEIPRSTFNRSHGHTTTFDVDYIYPVYCDFALPGDTFRMNARCQVRLATLLRPIMDNMYLDWFFFAVPVRLVWDNWEKFNGAQTNPGDSTSFVIPTFTADTPEVGTLHDYMGIPVEGQITGSISWSSLWARGYNLIYKEWFRDQNLINSPIVDTDDGPDLYTDYVLRKRGKRHDYFTSCLPWPQKGTAVSIPLGTTAPVQPVALANAYPSFRNLGGGVTGAVLKAAASADPTGVNADGVGAWVAGNQIYWDAAGPASGTGLEANLNSATSATINQLRQAFQIQKALERDARSGTRYPEYLKAHWGVTSPDARLQRPEYLGGGSTPIIVTPIAQNSASAAPPTLANTLAQLGGIGTASGGNAGFTKSFVEHCLVFGLVSVRADLRYQQGLNRMFSLSTRFDFPLPALSMIGEQAVLSKEIYMKGEAADNDVFGYQEKDAWCRYKPSIITGLMRSTSIGTLDVWHLAQKFTARPTLNQSFIESTTPVDRVVAVPTEPDFYGDFWFDLIAARPLPVFGTPGLIDHF